MNLKSVLFALGLLLISQAGISQNFKFGAQIGINGSSEILSKAPDQLGRTTYQPALTFNINAHIDYILSKRWSMAIEPGFIQKGTRVSFSANSSRLNAYYVQMPVLANFHILDKLYVSAGPELSYLVAANNRTNGNTYNNITSYENRFDLGALVGINYEIHKNLDLGLRYGQSFIPNSRIFWTDEFGDMLAISKTYHHYLQLLLRVKF